MSTVSPQATFPSKKSARGTYLHCDCRVEAVRYLGEQQRASQQAAERFTARRFLGPVQRSTMPPAAAAVAPADCTDCTGMPGTIFAAVAALLGEAVLAATGKGGGWHCCMPRLREKAIRRCPERGQQQQQRNRQRTRRRRAHHHHPFWVDFVLCSYNTQSLLLCGLKTKVLIRDAACISM